MCGCGSERERKEWQLQLLLLKFCSFGTILGGMTVCCGIDQRDPRLIVYLRVVVYGIYKAFPMPPSPTLIYTTKDLNYI
jgi:hypothetical protein